MAPPPIGLGLNLGWALRDVATDRGDGGVIRARSHYRFVLIFILVFVTHVHTTAVITHHACKHSPFSMEQISLCTTAHPLYTGVANIFGAPVSGATMRPDPPPPPRRDDHPGVAPHGPADLAIGGRAI
jgi:hypothetical protein